MENSADFFFDFLNPFLTGYLQELLTYLGNNKEEFPSHFSIRSSLALTVRNKKHCLSQGFPYPHTLAALADYLAMEPLKKLCILNTHFQVKGEKSKK